MNEHKAEVDEFFKNLRPCTSFLHNVSHGTKCVYLGTPAERVAKYEEILLREAKKKKKKKLQMLFGEPSKPINIVRTMQWYDQACRDENSHPYAHLM